MTSSSPHAVRSVNPRWILVVLSMLIAFSPVALDMYLPALPAIGEDLGASQGAVQMSLSAYFIGFCISQVVWGPLGDWLGRRAPIAGGIVLFVLGGAGCALSGDAGQLACWRLVQALGAGAAPVLARAIVRDMYGQDQSARTLSLMMLIMGVAPMVAPLLGGQLLLVAGWRSIFWFLCAFGLAALAALATIPETLPPARRQGRTLASVAASYVPLLGSVSYLSYALTGACFYGAMLAYIAGTPFVYIEYFGVPPQYFGFLFSINVAGMMVFNVVNRRLVSRIGSQRAMRLGTLVCAASGVALAACGVSGAFGLAGVAVPLFVFMSMNGVVGANSMAGGMSVIPGTAGAASGLYGAVQYGTGALTSWLVGLAADGTPAPMTLTIGIMGLAGVFCAFVMPRWARR